MEPEVMFTKRIHDFLKTSIENDENIRDNEIKLFVNNFSSHETIPFRIIRKIYMQNKNTDGKSHHKYLNEILQDSDLYLPTLAPPIKNPEYEARIEKLKAEQANKEYKKMVRNVDKTQKQKEIESMQIGKEVKELNRYLWVIVNFVVTVVCAFVFGYKATEFAFGGHNNIFGVQLVVGLFFGTIVFFADLWFVVKETS